MAYIFHEDELPKLVFVVPCRERFFANKNSPTRKAHSSISNARRPIALRRPSWMAPRTIFAGIGWMAAFGCKHKFLALTFIDTKKLPRQKTPNGEVTGILNHDLAGAKNVLGTLHWLKSGEKFDAPAAGKHPLIYLIGGNGRIRLDDKV